MSSPSKNPSLLPSFSYQIRTIMADQAASRYNHPYHNSINRPQFYTNTGTGTSTSTGTSTNSSSYINPRYAQPDYTSSEYRLPYNEDTVTPSLPPSPSPYHVAPVVSHHHHRHPHQYRRLPSPMDDPALSLAVTPGIAVPPPLRPSAISVQGNGNYYVDPYTQIALPDLSYNQYETYVRPLNQEHIDNQVHMRTGEGYNEFGYMPRRSPVEINGLATIRTSHVEEPTKDAKMIRNEREFEENSFRLPSADPDYLSVTHVGKEKAPSAKRIRKLRQKEEKELPLNTKPPPEQIRCGWEHYKDGARWEEVNKYREAELIGLKEQQRRQAETGESHYYF